MKSIHSILLSLCLVVIPLPSLSESFEASSTSPSEETVGVKVALAFPETSRSRDPGEGIDIGVEPPVPRGHSRNDTPLQVAVIYVPSPKLSTDEYAGTISDPLEPVNRAFFHFNDKLYFWVLKPVASGYSAVVPEVVRVSVRNFFSNVTTPVRLVNCLFQANFSCAGTEALRFFLNTTVGVAGFFDPAKKNFNYEKKEKDFGQTLGFYGIGPGFYFVWPILGPMGLRDSVGFVGDLFLDPQTYLLSAFLFGLGTKSYYQVNETSLTLGDYEDLKGAALDPYIALKDAYFQYRQSKIKEK